MSPQPKRQVHQRLRSAGRHGVEKGHDGGQNVDLFQGLYDSFGLDPRPPRSTSETQKTRVW